MKNILIEELSSPGCQHCKAFEDFWHSVERNYPNVSYKNVSITTPEGQEMASKYGILASPGIVMNGNLFSTGGFDKNAFLKKIDEMSK